MPKQFTFTVLGSGTSSGVPLVGCSCEICTSPNSKNKRLRSAAHIQTDNQSYLIDMGPDIRYQCLRENINRVDGILLTHTHADHVHGIDELRMFNAWQKQAIPVYGLKNHLDELAQKYEYIFNPQILYPSLVPQLNQVPVENDFSLNELPIQTLLCHHGVAGETLNYRIGSVAWVTDANKIYKESLEKLKGLDTLFLDAVRYKPHPTHFHFDDAIRQAKVINAKKTYLIHLGHDYDHEKVNDVLPESIELAYDGLKVFGHF